MKYSKNQRYSIFLESKDTNPLTQTYSQLNKGILENMAAVDATGEF